MTILDPPAAPTTTAQAVVDALVDIGITHSTGLPDSMNVHVLDALDADPRIAATRTTAEDLGAAAMMGLWIGGGRGVALMEGSGLGYCGLVLARMVNDRVPVLLLASHSGLHGEHHVYHQSPAAAGMGVLRGLGIEHHVAGPGADIPALVRSVGTSAWSMMRPVALVLPVRSITRVTDPAGPAEQLHSRPSGMSVGEVAETVLAERGDALIVGGPGFGSALLVDGDPEDVRVLSQMELGYCTPAAMGLAWSQPGRQVIAVDGDGSLTARLSVLADVARYGSTNLTIIVIDNRGYRTFAPTGSAHQPGATAWGLDLVDAARACGIEHVRDARHPAELRLQLTAALREPGPRLIVAHAPRVSLPAHLDPPRPSVLVTQALRHHLRTPQPVAGPVPPRP